MTREALEQVDKYIKEIDHLRKYISRLETQIVEQEPCEDKEYEKDLNKLKAQILEEGDTVVSKQDLFDRFVEVDNEYKNSHWNLLQILTNINILIGQEPCEGAISREDVIEDVVKCTDMNEDTMEVLEEKINKLPPVTFTRKKGKWIVEDSGNYNGKWSTCYCSNCKDYYTRNWREMNYCPNCGAKMEVESEE